MPRILLSVGVAGLLALTACGNNSDAAAPAGGTGTGTSRASGAGADPSVLGPDGAGGVTLGESRSDAAAAGLTWAPVTGYTDKSCPDSAPLPLPGFPTVHLSATLGVAVIEAAGAMHTPEGVRIGSTLAEVTKAYPRLTNATGDPHGLGVNSVPVPGNAKASYRIFIATGGTVASVDLMLNGSNCFLV